MQKTKKKLLTRILALLLCLIMCCSTVYAAGDYNENNKDLSIGPPDKYGGITTGAYFDDMAQGFRLYVVDTSGNVMQTTYGTDAIDVVFSGVSYKPSNVRLRVNNQSATTKYLSFNSVFSTPQVGNEIHEFYKK